VEVLTKKKQATKSFEEMMERLSRIVEMMESKDVPIEAAMALYEEGYGLISELRAVLDRAEEKVKLIGPDGKLAKIDVKEADR
jgi:exodeoxyribonuclease VII small subunit